MLRKAINKWDIVFISISIILFYLSFPVQSPKTLYVPKGGLNQTLSSLKRSQIDIGNIDKFLIDILGKPQSGWINIGDNRLTKVDFLYRLTHARAVTVNITLIPGETTVYFFKLMAKKLNLSYDELMKSYHKYVPYAEGYFVPNTYTIAKNISEEQLVLHLYKSAHTQHATLSHTIFGEYDKDKWFRYITIASIIQKEAANKTEMPIVSSVIQNRLKKRMRLQMDGTLNYGNFSHTKVTAKRIKEDMSAYNTYKYNGLPAIPVCVVSKAAIKAAIFPKKTRYLYFVRGKNGEHLFSSSYEKHKENIRSYRKNVN